jgi:hypothetical protein
MQSHHPHLRDLWLLGWLPGRWRKRKKNSASGKSRLCTNNSNISKNKMLPVLYLHCYDKRRFFIQFFPEYRRDDSYVNPHLLDHPLGAPLVISYHSVSIQADVFPVFFYTSKREIFKFIYLSCSFGALQIHSCLVFISGWMAYEDADFLRCSCPLFIGYNLSHSHSGYLVSSVHVILNLLNLPIFCNTSYKQAKCSYYV